MKRKKEDKKTRGDHWWKRVCEVRKRDVIIKKARNIRDKQKRDNIIE